MATATIDLAHPVQVVTDDQVDGLGYRAECSCGWASDWHADHSDAETAGVDHREVAAGPGDGPAVMGELLDLQGDLAGIVVWLAENWSADLPVPVVYGRGGGGGRVGPATVELSTYCTDPSDLTRIGHLLGVPAVDDIEPNPYNGARYHEAVRRFGRVSLQAFTNTTDGGRRRERVLRRRSRSCTAATCAVPAGQLGGGGGDLAALQRRVGLPRRRRLARLAPLLGASRRCRQLHGHGPGRGWPGVGQHRGVGPGVGARRPWHRTRVHREAAGDVGAPVGGDPRRAPASLVDQVAGAPGRRHRLGSWASPARTEPAKHYEAITVACRGGNAPTAGLTRAGATAWAAGPGLCSTVWQPTPPTGPSHPAPFPRAGPPLHRLSTWPGELVR
jgi:hypothetical protein